MDTIASLYEYWPIVGMENVVSALKDFYASEMAIQVSGQSVVSIRSGFRTVLKDSNGNITLSKHLSGQLPYYYRKLESVVADFESQHNAIEVLVDLMATAPNTPKFRSSHGAEILASHFLEGKLGLRRLYSKLTLTTSEDTNAHKMDALFVDTQASPYQYIFVEAKGSVLPTTSTTTSHHRNGLLTRMISSLGSYLDEEPRMEYVRIRENLEKSFVGSMRDQVLSDLRPPGPDLKFIGISVTNAQTVNSDDDDFILSTACGVTFDYYALVVTNLQTLAASSYKFWDEFVALAKKQ